MSHIVPFDLAFYLIVIVFAVLFLLQIWAILRIKEMLRQVGEIFRFVKAGTRVSPQRSSQAYFKNSCEFCKFRASYLSDEQPIHFIHLCKKHSKIISLNESCGHFTPDPQLNEN